MLKKLPFLENRDLTFVNPPPRSGNTPAKIKHFPPRLVRGGKKLF